MALVRITGALIIEVDQSDTANYVGYPRAQGSELSDSKYFAPWVLQKNVKYHIVGYTSLPIICLYEYVVITVTDLMALSLTTGIFTPATR